MDIAEDLSDFLKSVFITETPGDGDVVENQEKSNIQISDELF